MRQRKYKQPAAKHLGASVFIGHYQCYAARRRSSRLGTNNLNLKARIIPLCISTNTSGAQFCHATAYGKRKLVAQFNNNVHWWQFSIKNALHVSIRTREELRVSQKPFRRGWALLRTIAYYWLASGTLTTKYCSPDIRWRSAAGSALALQARYIRLLTAPWGNGGLHLDVGGAEKNSSFASKEGSYRVMHATEAIFRIFYGGIFGFRFCNHLFLP